jgi:hypothetical protein
MLTSQNLADTTKLGVWANMEYTIYSNGNIIVLSVERGFRQEKCSNRCIGICCFTGYKCNMVIDIWNPQHFWWSGYGIDPVDININNIVVFYRISKPAGLILIPYLIWVSIASYLNYTVFLLNH